MACVPLPQAWPFIDAAQAIEERLRVLGDEIDAIKGVAQRQPRRLGVVSTAKYFAPRMMAAS